MAAKNGSAAALLRLLKQKLLRYKIAQMLLYCAAAFYAQLLPPGLWALARQSSYEHMHTGSEREQEQMSSSAANDALLAEFASKNCAHLIGRHFSSIVAWIWWFTSWCQCTTKYCL